MAVRIARGSRTRWREAGDLYFMIESKTEASLLADVVGQLGVELLDIRDEDGLPAASFVSDIVPTLDGLVFWVDVPDASRAVIDRFVATVVGALEAAGIDGRVSAPETEVPWAESKLWAAIVAIPVASPVRQASLVLPTRQIDGALAWVVEGQRGDLWVRQGGVVLRLPVTAADALARSWLSSGGDAQLISDVGGERRHVRIDHPGSGSSLLRMPRVALSICGPSTDTDLDAAFAALVADGMQILAGASWLYATVMSSPPRDGPDRLAWEGPPEGADVLPALADRVLDAHPWQLLRRPQAALLPDDLDPGAEFDPTTGELRIATLDDWLREDVWRAGRDEPSPFRAWARAMLGPALATQDVAWEALVRRPSSTPRPVDEPEYRAADVDLDRVPIVSRPSAHPSLGVTPNQLASIRRGERYSDDPSCLSSPLKRWLRSLVDGTPDGAWPSLRRIVSDLTAGPAVGEADAKRHRRVLADWVTRSLAPELLDAADADGGDALRALPTLTDPIVPGSCSLVVVDVLRPVERRRRAAHHDEHDEEAWDAARPLAALAASTSGAATHVAGSVWQAGSVISTALDRLLMSDVAIDAETIHRLWSLGAVNIGTGVFMACYNAAEDAQPRPPDTWRRASAAGHDAGSEDWVATRQAGGVAVFTERDPSLAWATAFTAARAAAPAYWDAFVDQLARGRGADGLEQSWAAARHLMEALHPEAHQSAALAIMTEPVRSICWDAAVLAHPRIGAQALADLTWNCVDELVERLATRRS